MKKILTIVGARPQIIKAAALSRTVRTDFSGLVEEKIVHTGQHYDANMSQIFFDELDIPQAHFNLNAGSGNHGEQTAKMITGIEQILRSEPFDGLVVYGDTNSTLAGSVAAAKLHVPIFHIEAGLRSFNMAMPEEINRITCDHMSSILFAPTQTAIHNLEQEGFTKNTVYFKNGKSRWVLKSGDIMYDNSLYFARLADKKSDILERYALTPHRYILATLHRDSNTDDPERFTAIFKALLYISDAYRVQMVLPIHPRTQKILKTHLPPEIHTQLMQSSIQLVPPTSFLEMIVLEKNAQLVMTDSGGVQKEAYFFKKPCVILRPETEWVEIVEQHAGIIADADTEKIIQAYSYLIQSQPNFTPVFGNGKAAQYILENMLEYMK